MKKTSFLIAPRFIILSPIIISILFLPLFTCAATYYNCVDKEGNQTLTDHLVGGMTCKKIAKSEDMTDEEKDVYERDKKKKKEESKIDEKKWNEEYDKKKEEEYRKREAAANLNECFKQAHERSKKCASYCYGTRECAEQNRSEDMRCDYSYQQERNQCIQMYSQKP